MSFEQNGPDIVTICKLKQENYLCSASIIAQSTHLGTIKEQIAKDFMKTNPWFYWVNQDGEILSRLDRDHIEKYLQNPCLKCVRLVFVPNISLQELLWMFGANNLKDLCKQIVEYWMEKFNFKKAFSKEQLKHIKKQDEVVTIIDHFTIKTKRDRIVFVTKDHNFYSTICADPMSSVIWKIFTNKFVDLKDTKQDYDIELKKQLEHLLYSHSRK